MHKSSIRSPFKRALGLGSAKEGVSHWLQQRVSAIALIPLTVWFTASIIARVGSDHASVVAWLQTPVAETLLILLMIGLFYHMALGLQVIIEDYLHTNLKFFAVIAVNLGCISLAVAGILSVLRISLAG